MPQHSMTIERPDAVRVACEAMQTGETVLIYEDHASVRGRVVKLARNDDRGFTVTVEF